MIRDHQLDYLQQSAVPSLGEDQHLPAEHPLCEDTEIVEPQNQTERAIAQIWRNLFNLKSIRTDQNFFALGGDSMLALQLVEELEQTFDAELPLSTVFEAPTIQQLAQQIESCNSPSFYSLVPLQPHGSKPRLFGIHLLEYRALSEYLGNDQPIYGLRYGLAAKTAQHTPELPKRIEELAAHYIEELRSFQPEDPYWLMGFSLGGRVALEMAQQLIASGQKIELLIIFDTSLAVEYRINSLQQQVSAALELTPVQAWQRFRSIVHRRFHPQPAIISGQSYEPHQSNPSGEAHFFEPYSPPLYPGKVAFFQASDPSHGVFHRPALPSQRWRRIALGGLEVYEMPGDHHAMLKKPYVQLLAQHLQALIRPVVV